AQARGPSADGTERWRNWTVRQIESGAAIGFVQATITGDRPGETADVAWVIGVPWQGRGYATEAARAMARRLGDEGVATITAHVYPDHTGSERVAERLGLAPTDAVEDGERVWRGVVTGSRGEVVDPERRRRIAWVNVAVSIALMAFAAFDALMARSGATPSGPDQVIRDLVLAGAGIALLATTLLRRGR
ncbi:MAG: GNAT family N-acetyltransferase, partial [Candidatus Limnocylindrales bacterium]